MWCGVGKAIFVVDFWASILAGVGSSYLTIRNRNVELWLKILWFLFLVPVYAVVAFAISMFGCMLGERTGGTPIRFGG